MGYIGNRPADSYTSFAVQHFTTSATTTYSLDNPVANENEIALFINNVRQEPGSSYAYTASGTTLTLSAATSASDTMYCVFIGKAVQTVTPASGSVTNDMLAGSIANAKLANSSITLNGSAVSLGGSASVANTPAFHAQKTSNQSISNDTETLVSFDTELYDTDNAFDNSSTYRFTPQTAGKYYIYFNMRLNTSTDFEVNEIRVQKNGSTIAEKTWRQFYFDGKYIGVVVDLNGSSDYVNVDFYQSSGGSLDISGISNITYFGGYRLIGV